MNMAPPATETAATTNIPRLDPAPLAMALQYATLATGEMADTPDSDLRPALASSNENGNSNDNDIDVKSCEDDSKLMDR